MSSKRRIRRKSCDGKKRFDDYQSATRALYKLRNSDKYNGGYMRVYKCRFCGHYHIGHITKKAKQARRIK